MELLAERATLANAAYSPFPVGNLWPNWVYDVFLLQDSWCCGACCEDKLNKITFSEEKGSRGGSKEIKTTGDLSPRGITTAAVRWPLIQSAKEI